MKVLVYPKDSNPYQELIYSKLRFKTEIKYLENPSLFSILGLLLLYIKIPYYRIKGFRVFHLHWFYTFYPKSPKKIYNNLLIRTIYSVFFIIFILFIKIFRYRLIWTVHNILPLGNPFTNAVMIIKMLSKLTDLKIVHSRTTLKNMQKLGINTNNSNIISIGNYANLYPDTISKEQARRKLGITKKNFVFCFFGKIEDYKGVPQLLSEFLLLKHKNIFLIIAGECQNLDLKKRILEYKKNNNILLCLEFIPDSNVQLFLNAADITVFPFQTITTSSSVILALSFKKPVICPRIGNLEDLPENVGFFYEPDNKLGLLECLYKAITSKEKLEGMGINALKYVDNLSWDKIAQKTYEVYENII